jgi:hypothetical protein
LAALWSDLVNPDAEKADAAWRKLGSAGDNAIAFLRQQIRPIATPVVDLKQIEKLLAELDSEKFAIRERATKELLAAGELAIVPIQRWLEKQPSGEATRRARIILGKLAEPVLTTDRRCVLEAIALLEQLRTAPARALLEEIEREALVPQICAEARQALRRVGQLQKEKE